MQLDFNQEFYVPAPLLHKPKYRLRFGVLPKIKVGGEQQLTLVHHRLKKIHTQINKLHELIKSIGHTLTNLRIDMSGLSVIPLNLCNLLIKVFNFKVCADEACDTPRITTAKLT